MARPEAKTHLASKDNWQNLWKLECGWGHVSTGSKEAFLVSDIMSGVWVTVFISEWVFHHEFPQNIMSNLRPKFTSSLWKSMVDLLGVDHHMTSSYHPQANGMVKLLHWTLKGALHTYLYSPWWANELSLVMHGLRTTPKLAIGFLTVDLTFQVVYQQLCLVSLFRTTSLFWAEVECPILRTDFSCAHKLLVDMAGHCLLLPGFQILAPFLSTFHLRFLGWIEIETLPTFCSGVTQILLPRCSLLLIQLIAFFTEFQHVDNQSGPMCVDSLLKNWL